jgi:hypothetical protein
VTFAVCLPAHPGLISSARAEILIPEFSVQDLSRITLPEHIGKIEERFQGASDDFVWVIQDAHAVIDSQDKIHQTIQFLQEKAGTKLIAFEGADGRLDPTLFRAFPDAFSKEKTAREYLSRAELSGVEMAAIFNSKDAVYQGVEDQSVYDDNFAAYVRAAEEQKKVLTVLQEKQEVFDSSRKNIYSPELNLFHEEVQSLQEEKKGLLDFMKYAGTVSQVRGLLKAYSRHSQALFLLHRPSQENQQRLCV